jgi:hypothetical protein
VQLKEKESDALAERGATWPAFYLPRPRHAVSFKFEIHDPTSTPINTNTVAGAASETMTRSRTQRKPP